MKTLKNISKLILSLLVIIFFSCKKKDNNSSTNTTPPTPKGNIGFHLHTNVDTTEIDSGSVGVDAIGRKIQLNVAQFYISNITFKKSDGTSMTMSGVYALKDIANEEYILGQVPTGNYTAVTFNIGIDAGTNATNPSSHTGVLALQNPSMWFGNTNEGYIFMNIQGFGDTTGTGNYFRLFNYQLGTAAMLKTVTLDLNGMGMNMPPVSVTTTGTGLFHIICDYGALLQSINTFKTKNTIATPFNSDSLIVKQIANNVPNMFSFEM